MSSIHTFVALPDSLKSMAIELALIRARQDQYGNLRNIVEEAVAAAAAAADLEVNVKTQVVVDPAKAGAKETVTIQAGAANPNPDYVDPEIFDPKENNDGLDALGYPPETLLNAVKPEKQYGRPKRKVCSDLFGELKADEQPNNLRFVQILHRDGAFGPVDIYQSRIKPKVFAIMNKGCTALIESDNIAQLPYQATVEIVRVHGKADRSIVG
jgi:hypothetical protein